MANYEKMYSTLFNAITDALEQIEQQNFGSAKAVSYTHLTLPTKLEV